MPPMPPKPPTTPKPSTPSLARAALCAVALLAAGAAPASADGGGSAAWSAAPSAGGGTRQAEDGRPYVYAEGAPGTVLQDTVTVTNPGPRPRTVSLRGAPKDTGAWLTFAERRVKVPPRTRAEVPFTVTVPAGAVPGDHPGAIVVSGGGRTVGIRLHLRVGGPTLPALTVERVEVDKDAGRITYDLVNRGNTVLAPKLAVHAEGVFGTLVDRPARALPVELLPGRRVTLTEPWADTPAFDAADVRLTATASGGARDTATASARFVPWGALGGGAAGLLAVAAGAVHLVRGHRRGIEAAEPVAEAEAEGRREPAGAGRGEGP
ncbi:COG1470 family protein [Streptomyces sp. DSM 118878]